MAKVGSTLLALLTSLALTGVIAYFGWSALQGEYGWFSMQDAEARIEGLENEQARLEREIADLRRLIAGLKRPVIQLDLLDERARANLGYLREDEVILYE